MQERGLIVICDCTHLTICNEYVQCQSIEEVATSYGSPFHLVGVSFLCITRVSRGATEDGRTKIVSIKSSYPIPIQFQRGVTPVTLGTATRTLTTLRQANRRCSVCRVLSTEQLSKGSGVERSLVVVRQ